MANGEMNLPPGFELETEMPAGFEVEPMSVPEGFVLEETPPVPEQEGNIVERLHGAHMRGWMIAGRAVLDAPKHLVSQAKLLPLALHADLIYREKDPEKKAALLRDMRNTEDTFDKVAEELGQAGKWHKAGVKSIIEKHPEWESEPAENFVDLVTSPDKLAVAIVESTPVLLAAGILTYAGQPTAALGLMYAVEGQSAYDQAIADGATGDEAETSYVLYGTVSAALENMQLRGIMKIGKGMFNSVRNRAVQKVAQKGLKSLTMDVIRVAGQEALEEMSQGAWQEATAKIVYDKSVPGGIWGFIDRRAQEGVIGGLMGIIPGAGGAAVGKIAAATTDVRGHILSGVAEEDIAQDPGLTPEEKTQRQLVVGNIRTRLVTDTVQRFPKDVVDQTSLQEVGNAIAKHLNIDRDITWVWDTRPTSMRLAVHRNLGGRESRITVNYGHWDFQQGDIQKKLKETIIHELGHITMPPITEVGKRRRIHHKKFKQWYDDNKGALEQLVERYEPIPEVPGVVPAPPVEEPASVPTAEKKPSKREERRQLLVKGHQIPRQLGMDETARREYMESVTGKTSMKDMTPKEMRTYVADLEQSAAEAGIEIEAGAAPADPTADMIRSIEESRRKPLAPDIEQLNKPKLQQWRDDMKNGVTTAYHQFLRMERLLEYLDGHTEGPNYDTIWKPLKAADEATIDSTNSDIANFMKILEEKDIPVDQWVGKADEIEGETVEGKPRTFRLTASQRIGVHTLKQNKNGLRYLQQGMGFSDTDLTSIENAMDPKEKEIAEWLLDQYDAQFPIIETVANSVGIVVGKEARYAPILRRDLDLEMQPDFLTELADTFTPERTGPEKGMLEERKPGAYGKLELDAFVSYMYNLTRVNRFINMAPVASNLQYIMKNKAYRAAVNSKTADKGTRLMDKWIKDSVRGTAGESYTWFERLVSLFRRRGVVYAIGWAIPSSLRQTLSLSNAVAVDPLMVKYTPMNITRAAYPKGYRAMEQFVFERSASARTRSFDRDLRRKWNRQTITRRLKGKGLSSKSLAWIRWMDRHTVTVAWKSLYDVAEEKGMGEDERIAYADKWIGRTQPMANPKDLPAFYRGGVLERLITTFKNQVNQNFNFYMHDIAGAYKYGKISPAVLSYRLMFSWILPALMFGMIGRARLPKKPSEVLFDLGTYPLAGFVLAGRWIRDAIQGWGSSSSIVMTAPTEAQKAIGAAKRGNLPRVVFHAAKAIGAATGTPTAQMVRTTEGTIALIKGETKDPRRLIYSKWALREIEEEGKMTYYD